MRELGNLLALVSQVNNFFYSKGISNKYLPYFVVNFIYKVSYWTHNNLNTKLVDINFYSKTKLSFSIGLSCFVKGQVVQTGRPTFKMFSEGVPWSKQWQGHRRQVAGTRVLWSPLHSRWCPLVQAQSSLQFSVSHPLSRVLICDTDVRYIGLLPALRFHHFVIFTQKYKGSFLLLALKAREVTDWVWKTEKEFHFE